MTLQSSSEPSSSSSLRAAISRPTGPATRIGIIGAGNISGVYFQAAQTFSNIEIAACADLDLERARFRVAEYGMGRACSVEALLADPDIEIVLNLTLPAAHAQVALQALEAGKHVYNEKPLAITLEEARYMLELAAARNLRVGCAPDTFLGAGLQTCRQLIDAGLLGEPIAASGYMMCTGHEGWHPDPASYYQNGGGPLFDMGPYYLIRIPINSVK